MNVELIYDADCPNVAATRSVLIKAFAKTGASACWREWERSAPESPEYVRRFGSPTILVDGEDVVPDGKYDAASCRIYADSAGQIIRTPPFDTICAALLEGAPPRASAPPRGRWHMLAVSFPAIGTALLPKLVCPLCFPAYGALLSALGLGFVDYTPYLLPLTAAFLTMALGALAFHTYRHGRWLPLLIGLVAVAITTVGKFFADSESLTVVGVVLLVGAIVLTMRKQTSSAASCPACVSTPSGPQPQVR